MTRDHGTKHCADATPYRPAKCGDLSSDGRKCDLPKAHEGHHRKGSKRWAQRVRVQ